MIDYKMTCFTGCEMAFNSMETLFTLSMLLNCCHMGHKVPRLPHRSRDNIKKLKTVSHLLNGCTMHVQSQQYCAVEILCNSVLFQIHQIVDQVLVYFLWNNASSITITEA